MLIISIKCVATLFFILDSNSPSKDQLWLHSPNLAQTPLYLVGNVLKYRAGHWVRYLTSPAVNALKRSVTPSFLFIGQNTSQFSLIC